MKTRLITFILGLITLFFAIGPMVTPADAQVAVQPRVQPGAAIGLQRDHLPTDDITVGMLLDPQVGAVGVAADDPERSTVGVVAAVPGHQ